MHCQPSERLQHLSNLVKLWPEGEMDVDQLKQAMQRAIDNPKAVVKRRRRTSLGSSDASVGPEATRPSAGIHRLERYVHPKALPSFSIHENHNCMPPLPTLTMHPYHSSTSQVNAYWPRMKSSLQLFRISWIRLARLSAPVSAASRQVSQVACLISSQCHWKHYSPSDGDSMSQLMY